MKPDESPLRRLTVLDLPEVLAIEKSCYAEPWSVDNFLGEFSRPMTVTLGLGPAGRLEGYCFFWLTPPEVHLLNLAVQPAAQGCGRGRRLLEGLAYLGRRAGATEVFLEVRPSNARAVGLYGSMGFVKVGCRPHYYDDGEDAWLMTLKLKQVERTATLQNTLVRRPTT